MGDVLSITYSEVDLMNGKENTTRKITRDNTLSVFPGYYIHQQQGKNCVQ